MIDEEKTFELFGYHSYDLRLHSVKKIVCICNDCGKERILSKDWYNDLCLSCSISGEDNHMFGKHHSIESKEKMSKAKSGKSNPFFGKHHSIKTKDKMSKSSSGKNNPNFGKHFSIEVREKMSKARKGEKSWWFGIHHSIESREKMSEAHKGKNCGKDNPNYIDGKSYERADAKDRGLPVPKIFLGDRYCNGMIAHHMTEKVIIYIPAYIHRKNYHNLKNGIGMMRINMLALIFLLRGF